MSETNEPRQARPDEGRIDLNRIEPEFRENAFRENGNDSAALPASGGTFAVTHDESGYQPPSGLPNAVPYGGGQGFGAPAMAPPQYGTQGTPAHKSDAVAYSAIAFGILALVLLLVPSWAYLAGGALGVVAIVLGAMRLRGPGSTLALIGLLAGAVAVALAVATAVLVYVI